MSDMKMKFIGRDNVRVYTEKDNYRDTPDGGPMWQDSTWLQWWDLESGCGGVHRIGHEYEFGEGGPFVAGWSNLVTPKGYFKHVTYLPLRESDKLKNGWGSGDDVANNEIVNGEHIWNINDPATGVSARLVFTDYHGAFCGFPSSGQTAKDITSHHIDISGPVTGTITMPGGTFQVNGMGLRDHGWGHRDIGTMLSHRYVTGCFGPDLSFCAYSIHSANSDRIETFGWAVKGDTVIFATDVDIIVYAESDSCSTRGGHIKLALADGDVLDCELTAVAPGLVNQFHTFNNNNTLCRAEIKGRVGTGHVETSMNFHNGTRRADRMLRALIKNGFYPGSIDDLKQSGNNPFIIKRTL